LATERAELRIGSRFILTDERQQRFRPRGKALNLGSLIIQFRTANRHDSGVIGSAGKAQFFQIGRRQRWRRPISDAAERTLITVGCSSIRAICLFLISNEPKKMQSR
jgi:hypothetical protein